MNNELDLQTFASQSSGREGLRDPLGKTW